MVIVRSTADTGAGHSYFRAVLMRIVRLLLVRTLFYGFVIYKRHILKSTMQLGTYIRTLQIEMNC